MQKTIGREEFENLLRLKMRPDDVRFVMRAYRHSKYGHRGQTRDTGERYFEHPKAVALILMLEFGVYDPDIIASSLLHDTDEDTYLYGNGDQAFIEIAEEFNPRVALIVRTVSKVKCGESQKEARDAAYYAGIRDSQEIGVKLVKFADRLHNTRTLPGCAPEKIERYIKETLEKFPQLLEGITCQELKDLWANITFQCALLENSKSQR